MSLKILITGGNGFVGQHLLEELKAADVFIRTVARTNSNSLWTTNRNVENVFADISDISALEPSFIGIDIVINLAAEKNDSSKMAGTNIKGIENIISLAKKFKIKKIIHVSSTSVFGKNFSRKKEIIKNASACRPRSPYGIAKLKSENLLQSFAQEKKAEIIIIRSCPVFGEHQLNSYLDVLVQKVKNGNPISIMKNGVINCIYVKDLAYSIRHFIFNETGNKTIIAGGAFSHECFMNSISNELKISNKTKNVSPFFISAMEMLFYFGSGKLKGEFRAASNQLKFDDSFMKNVVGYKYGIETGIYNTILASG